MPRGFKDKAVLGKKGQGSGRDSANFSPAGRWWQEGSCGVVPAPVLGHPSWVRPMVKVGGSRQAHWAKGTGMHDLGWGHRTRGTPLPLQGLWAGWCPM